MRADVIDQIGPGRVRSAVANRSLRALWPRVLVEGRRWADLRTRGAAALLAFGPESVLTGRTAAQLHGCDAAATPKTHLLLPYEHYVRPRFGLVTHHAHASLFRDDIEVVDGLRVLALDRVVADLLCDARRREALAVADQALGKQPEDVRERYRMLLRRRLDERPDRRRTIQGYDLLALATGRAESPPESWLLLQIADLGFPLPEVNWQLRSAWGTEIYRLDLAWPDLRIVLEYDGLDVHAERGAEDAARQNDLERRGWIVIRVTVADLSDPSHLAARLHEAFRHRGFTW